MEQQGIKNNAKGFLKRALDGVFGNSAQGRARGERVKFFIKWELFGFFGRVLIFFFGARVNKDGWDGRVLVIGPGGIGDVIMTTPALRYYREHFKGKKIYVLVTEHGGMTKSMFGDLVDEVLTIDGKDFQTSPLYKMKFINRLRRIGFATVINQAMGLKDITSKVVSVSLGARMVVNYEGPGVELANPAAEPFRRLVAKHIAHRSTAFISSIDKGFREGHSHPKTSILHNLAICEAVIGTTPLRKYATAFFVDDASRRAAREKLSVLGVLPGKYAIFVVTCVDAARRWELEKFAAVAEHVAARGYRIVLIGSPSQREFNDSFGMVFPGELVNVAGTLSLPESSAAIGDAHYMVANDTGPVHIAIALGTPVVCIPTCGHLAMNSLYGRPSTDRWTYKNVGCLYDDARCVATVPPGAPAPCVAAVTAGDVIKELDAIDRYLAGHAATDEAFLAEFKDTPNLT